MKLSGFTLHSELPLASLGGPAERDGTGPELFVVRHRGAPLQFSAEPVDREAYLVGPAANGHLLRFEGLFDVFVHAEADRASVLLADDCPAEVFEQLFVDQVLPLILHARGRLPLHASGVELDGRVLLFLGPSGHGKSTLAAALATRLNALLFTDDCAAIHAPNGSLLVEPSYPSARLWAPSVDALFSGQDAPRVSPRSDKRRLVLRTASNAAPLGAIFQLAADSDSISVERLSAAEVVRELPRHTYRLSANDARALAAEFAHITAIARTTSVFVLRYPRRFEALPEVLEQIRAATEGLAQK